MEEQAEEKNLPVISQTGDKDRAKNLANMSKSEKVSAEPTKDDAKKASTLEEAVKSVLDKKKIEEEIKIDLFS